MGQPGHLNSINSMIDPIMLAHYSMLTLRIFRIEHLASVYIEAYRLQVSEQVPPRKA